jgi:hypothetical protein
MNNIIDINEFDPSNLVLKDPRDNPTAGKNIPVRYNCPRRGEIPILFKTPRLDLPYGISQWPPPDKCVGVNPTEIKYNLDVFITGRDSKKVALFKTKLASFQAGIHNLLQKDSKRLLGKSCSLEVVQDKCNPILKNTDEESNRPCSFKLKLRRDEIDKVFTDTIKSVDVYQSDGSSVTKVPLTIHNLSDVFERKSSLRGLVACYSLTLINGNISIPLRPVQIQTYPGVKAITTNVFLEDSDDEGDQCGPTTPSPSPKQPMLKKKKVEEEPPQPIATQSLLADSDDDDDDDEEEEEKVVVVTDKVVEEEDVSKKVSKSKKTIATKPKKKKKVEPEPVVLHEDSDSDVVSLRDIDVSSDEDDSD